MKLTPIWQKIVTSPFEKRNCILMCSVLGASYSAEQSELITYLVKSGVNDSNNRVKDFLAGDLRVGAFGKVECKFPIDWQADPHSNRTWQWLHHQLAILGDFSCLIASGQHNYLIETACLIIDDWSENNFVEELPSEFSWGDHSTAHRLKNLVNFLIVAKHLLSLQKIECYLKLIDVHCKVLSTAKFFNKHTNHGLDQVLYLLLASCYFPQLKSAERYQRIAIKRLEGEIENGFAKDGVHVENSPQYHFILLNRLATFNSLVTLYNLKSIIDLPALFSKAMKFARYIKRPDSLIPIIGDSELKKAFLSPLFSTMNEYHDFHNDDALGAIESHLFKDSGYYTYRKKLTNNRRYDLHFIIKCGYLSNYHRQDDDGSFVLMAYGEDWFVDGGLYKHDNKDPIRNYLRGVKAHNTIFIKDAKINRRFIQEPNHQNVQLNNENSNTQQITANINMYPGYKVTRHTVIDKNHIAFTDEVYKLDEVKKDTQSSFLVLFHVPSDKQVMFLKNKVIISSTNCERSVEIVCTNEVESTFYLFKQEETERFTSKHSGQLEDVQTIVLESLQSICKYSVNIEQLM